ncbi:unnamed protein product [Parajaminaea phylloscopi]
MVRARWGALRPPQIRFGSSNCSLSPFRPHVSLHNSPALIVCFAYLAVPAVQSSPLMSSLPVRRASHAGSWYTDDGAELNGQLDHWLETVASAEPVLGRRKAIIAPHAGYSYSGPTAAYAYKQIPERSDEIRRVFLLGPSHHYYLDGCALSNCSEYATPIGSLPVDRQLTQELYATGEFEYMSRKTDEDEHSLEMHAPYIRKVFHPEITLVPILVGSISTSTEAHYGALLAPYLADPANFFVISSDFCHWGSRFSYTFYRPSPSANPLHLSSRNAPNKDTPIHQSIRDLDHEGMDCIVVDGPSGKTARQSRDDFAAYLRRTKNTICGRHPIGVLLGAMAHLEEDGAVRETRCRFTQYQQSSACLSVRDSSVSYASAIVDFETVAESL